MNAQQLKNAILQEAIQGRLVPQDPNDEPASVLLDRIRKEKAKLVKEGKLKKKDLEEKPISEDEIPFEIPESWEWCRVLDIGITETGTTPTKIHPEYYGDYIAFLSPANILNNTIVSETQGLSELGIKLGRVVPKNTILQVCIGGSIGKCAISHKAVTFNQQINSITPILCQVKYIHFVLQSRFFLLSILDKATGTATPIINRSNWEQLLLPLPPLAEQHRIVSKIEELLPKVEEYGKAQEVLDKLNKELPERLKKSILQESIQGRLVPQDPNDEPASVLLDRVRKEKAKLVKEGKLKKKDLEEIPIEADEMPFKLPKGWTFVRLGEVTYNHGQKTPDSDFSYIDIGSIDNEHQKISSTENILSCKDAPSRARKLIKSGDIIYATVRPYLHNMCIIDRSFSKEPIASTGFAVLSCINGLYNKFLFYYLQSPIFDDYANDGDNAKGVAYPAINDGKLYKGVVPLPPLAEQHRIVAKIEQLLNEIDKLKKEYHEQTCTYWQWL